MTHANTRPRHRSQHRGARALKVGLISLLLVGCSDSDRPEAVAFDTAHDAFDALNEGGFECRDPEQLEFFYESVGPVDAVACTFDHSDGYETELLVGVFSTVEPSRELLDDFTNELVVGPNWVVSVSDDPAGVIDAIGGELVTDRSDYPEGPEARGDESDANAADATVDEEGAAETSTTNDVDDAVEGNVFAQGTAEWSSSGFLSSWQADDRDAAAQYTADATAIEEAFDSGFDPSDARLTGCEFVATEMNGVYASYLCEAVLPDAQSIQFYVDGGASAGYYVAHVGLNGNPVGWEPVD